MDSFAREVLEPKVWLTGSKTDSLVDAQRELATCVDMLEDRLRRLERAAAPLNYSTVQERITALRLRLRAVNTSLEASHARLRAIELRLEDSSALAQQREHRQ